MLYLSRVFLISFTSLILLSSVSVLADHQAVVPFDLYRDPPSHLAKPDKGSVLEKETRKKQQQEETERRIHQLKEAEKALFSDDLPPLSVDREERLAVLFKILQSSQNSVQAERAVREIQLTWQRSGSETIDLMFAWANQAIEQKEYAKALDYLDNIIRIKPDFAEAWNKRANVYFLQKEFSKSLADLERVLALEPRHFSALSGLGVMLQEIGDEITALSAFQKALDLNPTMSDLEEIIERLEKNVKGRES